jgi:hypothetical protein
MKFDYLLLFWVKNDYSFENKCMNLMKRLSTGSDFSGTDTFPLHTGLIQVHQSRHLTCYRFYLKKEENAE